GLDSCQVASPFVQVEGCGVGQVRHRQPAADVQRGHGTDALGQPGQFGVHLAPVAVDLDAAAQVRVQTGDARIQRARGGDEVVDARGRQPELGIGATGADLVVVAFATPQVQAKPQLATAEQLGPALQRLDVV